MTDIAIIRQTTAQISVPMMQDFVNQVNRALRQEFYDVWGTWATVWVNAPPAGAYQVILQDSLDQPGDLGYHVDTTGLPTARIDVPLCAQYGDDWRTCVAHEIFEMVVNPTAAETVGVYLKECCDPVTGQTYNGWLPNFVTPAWFQAQDVRQPPFDYMRKLLGGAPTIELNGGYMEYKKDGVWTSARGMRAGYMSSRTNGRRAWAKSQTSAQSLPVQG